MDFSKTSILLEKINALHKSMSADPNSVNSIERDLLLSYLRKLYEHALIPVQQSTTAQRSAVESAPPPPPPPPRQEVAPPPPPPPQEPLRQEPPPPPPPQPQVVTPPPQPRVIQVPELEPTPTPPPAASSNGRSASEKYDELFEVTEAKEIGDKLGDTHIPDLTKALGLNDKFLTINELFGGNSDHFNQTLQELNRLRDFEEARGLLLNVAEQYSWADKDKYKKAKIFVKLVRRRYL